MKKNILKIIFLFIIISILTACSNDQKKEVFQDNENDYNTLLASIDHEQIFLYGRKSDLSYKGMKLIIKNKSALFDWTNNRDLISHGPQLTLADVNNDGENELIIIRIEGFGSGIYDSNINIINMKTLNEIKIDNPICIIEKHVKSKIDLKQIKLFLNNQTVILDTKNYTNSNTLFNKVEFGSEVYYSISNNKLNAKVSAQITPGAYIGYILIDYTYNDSKFTFNNISFEKYEINF